MFPKTDSSVQFRGGTFSALVSDADMLKIEFIVEFGYLDEDMSGLL